MSEQMADDAAKGGCRAIQTALAYAKGEIPAEEWVAVRAVAWDALRALATEDSE